MHIVQMIGIIIILWFFTRWNFKRTIQTKRQTTQKESGNHESKLFRLQARPIETLSMDELLFETNSHIIDPIKPITMETLVTMIDILMQLNDQTLPPMHPFYRISALSVIARRTKLVGIRLFQDLCDSDVNITHNIVRKSSPQVIAALLQVALFGEFCNMLNLRMLPLPPLKLRDYQLLPDHKMETPLIYAIRRSPILAHALLDLPASYQLDVNYPYQNQIDPINRNPYDVTVTDNQNPLHYAVRLEDNPHNLLLCERLIQRMGRESLNAYDLFGSTPLITAIDAWWKSGINLMVDILLSYAYDDRSGIDLLKIRIFGNPWDIKTPYELLVKACKRFENSKGNRFTSDVKEKYKQLERFVIVQQRQQRYPSFLKIELAAALNKTGLYLPDLYTMICSFLLFPQ